MTRTSEGKVNFAQDFFSRKTFLTVCGQLNIDADCLCYGEAIQVLERANEKFEFSVHWASTWSDASYRSLGLDRPRSSTANDALDEHSEAPQQQDSAA